eukprot:617323-Pelagomonas_calceolata.AAC.3
MCDHLPIAGATAIGIRAQMDMMNVEIIAAMQVDAITVRRMKWAGLQWKLGRGSTDDTLYCSSREH